MGSTHVRDMVYGALRKTFLVVLVLPTITLAHEVYVLDPLTIAHDVAAASPNPFFAYVGHEFDFFFWGTLYAILTLTIFFSSVFHLFEKYWDPLLMRLKKYAGPMARVTLGASVIACAYNQGLFGPELPFSTFGNPLATFITYILYGAGIVIIGGLYTRTAILFVLCVFLIGIYHWGLYMLNYANYLGEILLALILGGSYLSIDGMKTHHIPHLIKHTLHRLEPYSFAILRVLYGIAIMFAAFYAKFLHSQLALDTISKYHLTQYFHFDPLFIVLGAFIIESLIGLFFIVGFEVRWTAIFFLFWLCLSLVYFGEAVWPHLILIGLNIAFILRGYDQYSLEGMYLKKHRQEPVL